MIPFWKLQAIGNDFPLLHQSDVDALAASTGTSVDFTLASLAVKLSDRHFGIGGDGILVLSQDLVLRMFNPDGTEDFCGNGLRCAAWHANLMGWMGSEANIKHLDRVVPVSIRGELISTTIGTASYDPTVIPTAAFGEIYNNTVWSGIDGGMPLSIPGSALNTGTAHVVIPTYALPDDDTFLSVSPKIEVDPMYPNRTSVIWAREVEPMKLEIRIWERGAGETQGCGSGSSAAAANYMRSKGKGGTVEVKNPGGSVFVSADRWDAPLTIRGLAQAVYAGEFKTS